MYLLEVFRANRNNKRPLTDEELKRILEESEEEPFVSSGSEYDPSSENSTDDGDCDETEEDDLYKETQPIQNLAGGDNNLTPLVQQWGAYIGRHKQMIFTGRSGIQVDITQNIHPVDIYNMFLL